jgi:hypothetical protein
MAKTKMRQDEGDNDEDNDEDKGEMRVTTLRGAQDEVRLDEMRVEARARILGVGDYSDRGRQGSSHDKD